MNSEFDYGDAQTDVLTHSQTKKPNLFHVVMHNDDYTTMDFVVSVLLEVFAYQIEKAVSVMMQIHEMGRAIVATLPKDIAEMKIQKVEDLATQAEYPLMVTMESAD